MDNVYHLKSLIYIIITNFFSKSDGTIKKALFSAYKCVKNKKEHFLSCSHGESTTRHKYNFKLCGRLLKTKSAVGTKVAVGIWNKIAK